MVYIKHALVCQEDSGAQDVAQGINVGTEKVRTDTIKFASNYAILLLSIAM